jgi:hypothetical protein
MLGTAVCLALLEFLPVDFPYPLFAVLLFLTGLTMASFGSPNRAGVMNSLPPQHRGAGSGMNTTFQNSAQVLSIGIFFTLMIVGLMSSLPHNLLHGLTANGVPTGVADHVAHLSPVSTLFAAFLGYDPVQHLIGAHALSQLTAAQQHTLTGRSFFPGLISAPFRDGLHAALDFAIVASLLAAGASWLRGGRYVYSEPAAPGNPAASDDPAAGAGTTGRATGNGNGNGNGNAPSLGRPGDDEGEGTGQGAPADVPVPVGASSAAPVEGSGAGPTTSPTGTGTVRS